MTAERKLHILVMSADWQSALACIQSYGRKGHTVSIVLRNKTRHPNHVSVFVKTAFFLKETEMVERARELVELAGRHAIDLVVPISDLDAVLVATAKELFPDCEALITSSLQTVAITQSRNSTTELCRSLGIHTPNTIFTTHSDAAEAADKLGYPCFLKLSGTFGSLGVFEIPGKAALATRLEQVPAHKEMQLQEKVEGDLVDITGFALDGKVVESFAFRCDYIHSRAGTPAYSERVHDDRLHEILAKITGRLRWTGGIDLDLLQRSDGTFALLEINPRFSGTTVFALKVGIDLPACYINARSGVEQSETFKPARQGVERFVSLFEESYYLKGSGEIGRRKALTFRADDKWVDNSFWDDRRYSAALFDYVRTLLLRPK